MSNSLPDNPIHFEGYEEQSPKYVNIIAIYDEGGSIVFNLAFVDRLQNVIESLLTDSDEDENESLAKTKSVGRFVMSYDTAYDLLENLQEILKSK